ncbi:RNA polymerase sigma factor RpoE [Labilithrix luteola]|uniref:RNA polymerase sigma factor RpoE n=1 Tax=Labilithrix luteola TaxID=1391654 RepID=A0A0K1QFN4_9BACT|nr:sigma-70 family RNA polymerase sigma factor [Labilithrix luteola]AKV04591.1 RNA polymerase sigma factor RpoE [Labilithrix luteola]
MMSSIGESPPYEVPAEAAPRGQALAFPDVYREHVGFVWRSVRGLGVKHGAVDDVAQEIFVVVARRLPEFEGRSSVRTWLSGIILNVVRHHRRSIQRKSPHETASGGPALDPQTLPANVPTPYEAVVHAEETLLLERILDELDDEKREVLVLAELEEMSVPEIAGALDIKLNTAYSRLRLARQAFEQALARHRSRDGWRYR